MECLLAYLCMVTVSHIMVGFERMLDYRGVGLERFHCICNCVPLLETIHIVLIVHCVICIHSIYVCT